MPGSTVAANIRGELAARDETQAELAQLLGLTHSSMSRRLRGETPFRDHEVGTVAAYFDVSVASLYAPRLRVVPEAPEAPASAKSRQRRTQRRKPTPYAASGGSG
jgi:transcriptional regulator with XRE-family HTH domain